MTQKELSYVEDALNQEKNLEKTCEEFSKQIKDEELKKMLQDLAEEHKTHFKKFYKLLDL